MRPRFKYLDRCLNELYPEKYALEMLISHVLDDDDAVNFQDNVEISPRVSTSSFPLVQMWLVPERDLGIFVGTSKLYQERYSKGEKDALRKFCRLSPYAFRAWWVLDAIETLRKENTQKSRRELSRIFADYVATRGNRSTETLGKALLSDRKCHELVLKHLVSEGTEEKAIWAAAELLAKASKGEKYKENKVKEAYYAFKGRKFNERVSSMRAYWRFIFCGFPKQMPGPSRIDPVLEIVYGLRTFRIHLKDEFQMYKQVRRRAFGIVYSKRGYLVRSSRKRKSTVDLELAIKQVQATYWGSRDHFRSEFDELYSDFLRIENLQSEGYPNIL